MAVDKSYIVDLSSAFADVDADRITRLVERLGDQVPASKWGAKRDLGLAYLVMHTIALGDMQGGMGQVKRERLRDIETEYAVPTIKDANGYSLTAWGQEFLRMLRQIPTSPLVT